MLQTKKFVSIGVIGFLAYNSGFNHINYAKSPTNSFTFGVHMIPHPKKAYKGGEDAYYADEGILSVADGVGGWADQGVDPGLYSKELCSIIGKLWLNNIAKYQLNPKKLIIDSSKLTTHIGTSTCCILTIDPNLKLVNSAYIGDSGYLLYRQKGNNMTYEPYFVSPEHCRSFNFPYQIGTNGDDPNMSLEKKHEIVAGDIVIVGTDGLLDNVTEDEMSVIVNKKGKAWVKDMNGLAKELADQAFQNSINRKKSSPFQVRAKEHGLYYVGGKPDDITVLTAIINLK